MGLKYVLSQAGRKMGLNSAVEGERNVLLRFANEAADELYTQSDMPNSLMEQLFKVNGDQTVSFPAHIGYPRAMREFFSQIPMHFNQLRPRYNVANWKDQWRNWRQKSQSPLQRSVRNAAQAVITVHAVETPNIVVTLTGSTEFAESVTETITMDAVSKNSVHSYTDYTLVAKNRVNQYDVIMLDVDGLMISTIPNNQLEAQYSIIDVSQFPWLNQNVSQQAHYMEVLFKRRLPWYQNDGDSFPAQGYDNIWVDKMIQLWAEEEEKIDLALAKDAKATRGVVRKKEDMNMGTEEVVCFAENPHDQMVPQIRGGRWWRFRSPWWPFGGQ